mmetsp:Transcript_40628/g.60251  ORF Transcript_40628/g.60251 Transcript_40628/m.60251 type:complete len:136 (-) Transcript_40628:1043-1450(-)
MGPTLFTRSYAFPNARQTRSPSRTLPTACDATRNDLVELRTSPTSNSSAAANLFRSASLSVYFSVTELPSLPYATTKRSSKSPHHVVARTISLPQLQTESLNELSWKSSAAPNPTRNVLEKPSCSEEVTMTGTSS